MHEEDSEQPGETVACVCKRNNEEFFFNSILNTGRIICVHINVLMFLNVYL